MSDDVDSVHCAAPVFKFNELFLHLSHWEGPRYSEVHEPWGSVKRQSAACRTGTPSLQGNNRWLTQIYRITHIWIKYPSLTHSKHGFRAPVHSPEGVLQQSHGRYGILPNRSIFILAVWTAAACGRLKTRESFVSCSCLTQRFHLVLCGGGKVGDFLSEGMMGLHADVTETSHNPIQARTLDCLLLIFGILWECTLVTWNNSKRS